MVSGLGLRPALLEEFLGKPAAGSSSKPYLDP